MARPLMTTEQILSVLRDTPDRLRCLTGDMTEAKLHAAPEPGEWSVTEIAAHLRSCADVWGQAIEAIAVTDHANVQCYPDAVKAGKKHGVNVLFGDGHVAFIKDSISLVTLRSLVTPAGGEVISSDQY